MNGKEMRYRKACDHANKMHWKTGLTYVVIERMTCVSEYDITTWDNLTDDQEYLYSAPDHEVCPG